MDGFGVSKRLSPDKPLTSRRSFGHAGQSAGIRSTGDHGGGRTGNAFAGHHDKRLAQIAVVIAAATARAIVGSIFLGVGIKSGYGLGVVRMAGEGKVGRGVTIGWEAAFQLLGKCTFTQP